MTANIKRRSMSLLHYEVFFRDNKAYKTVSFIKKTYYQNVLDIGSEILPCVSNSRPFCHAVFKIVILP